MNYEKDYNYYYDKFYSKVVHRIKQYYIEQSKKEITFGVTHNKLVMYLSSELVKTMYLNSKNDLMELLKKFNDRKSLYRKNEINFVVENDIKPAFDKLNRNDFPANYHLKKLLIQIAMTNAIKEIGRLLHNNNRLFELFYEFNEFDNFEIRDYSPISLENSDIFISFNKRKYPSSYNYKPSVYVTLNDDDSDEINLKSPSLPLAITILNEIGFFELEKIKRFSPQQLAKLISIIQIKDPNDKNTLRSISGNVRIAKGGMDNAEKYTACSNKNKDLAKKLFDEIIMGSN